MALLTISLGTSFSKGWLLTLLCLSTLPIMIAAQYLEIQFVSGVSGDTKSVRPSSNYYVVC